MTPDVPTPPSAFAPLPIRSRSTLEILDTALKLYRRYFGVLIGWSAITAVGWLLSILIPFVYLLMAPFVYASVACAVAAAVRGQKINFSQVWSFTKPRYGALVGVILVSGIVLSLLVGFLFVLGFVVFGVGVYVLEAAPEALQIVGGILGFILGLLLFSVASVAAFGWLNMVPIIACLEDDKRGLGAMGRATELMKGHWRRLFGLAILLGLAMLAVFAFVGGFLGIFFGGFGAFDSSLSESAFWGLGLSASAMMALFFLFWTPAQSLIMAVFYLDLRTRKEALDLEWTNYATTAPAPAASSLEVSPAPNVANPALLEPMNSAPSSFGSAAPSVSAHNTQRLDLSKTEPTLAPPLNPPSTSAQPTFSEQATFGAQPTFGEQPPLSVEPPPVLPEPVVPEVITPEPVIPERRKTLLDEFSESLNDQPVSSASTSSFAPPSTSSFAPPPFDVFREDDEPKPRSEPNDDSPR